MPHTRTGKHKPVHSGPYSPPFLPKTSILTPDFDKIPEAEDEAVEWVSRGHILETDIPRNS